MSWPTPSSGRRRRSSEKNQPKKPKKVTSARLFWWHVSNLPLRWSHCLFCFPPLPIRAEIYPSLRPEAMTFVLELAKEKGKRIKMLDDYALVMIKPREGILEHNGTTLPKEQAAVLQDGCRALNDYITQQRVREMKDIKGRLKGKGGAARHRDSPAKQTSQN